MSLIELLIRIYTIAPHIQIPTKLTLVGDGGGGGAQEAVGGLLLLEELLGDDHALGLGLVHLVHDRAGQAALGVRLCNRGMG